MRFLFRPSLAGAFRETLTIHNMQDRSDVQQVTLKAEVKRIDTFQVRAPPLDFAPCSCNKPTYDQRRLVLVNTSRGARSYVVEGLSVLRLLDGSEAPWWRAAVGLRLEQATTDGAEELKKQERQREDVLEKLERKLKIAMRKRKLEKVEKLRRKIAGLKAGERLEEDESDAEGSDWYNSESDSEEPVALNMALRGDSQFGSGVAVRRASTEAARQQPAEKLRFRLGRGGTQTMAITLRVHAVEGTAQPHGMAMVTGQVRVMDARDDQCAQTLSFTICVCSGVAELREAQHLVRSVGPSALAALPPLAHPAGALPAPLRLPDQIGDKMADGVGDTFSAMCVTESVIEGPKDDEDEDGAEMSEASVSQGNEGERPIQSQIRRSPHGEAPLTPSRPPSSLVPITSPAAFSGASPSSPSTPLLSRAPSRTRDDAAASGVADGGGRVPPEEALGTAPMRADPLSRQSPLVARFDAASPQAAPEQLGAPSPSPEAPWPPPPSTISAHVPNAPLESLGTAPMLATPTAVRPTYMVAQPPLPAEHADALERLGAPERPESRNASDRYPDRYPDRFPDRIGSSTSCDGSTPEASPIKPKVYPQRDVCAEFNSRTRHTNSIQFRKPDPARFGEYAVNNFPRWRMLILWFTSLFLFW